MSSFVVPSLIIAILVGFPIVLPLFAALGGGQRSLGQRPRRDRRGYPTLDDDGNPTLELVLQWLLNAACIFHLGVMYWYCFCPAYSGPLGGFGVPLLMCVGFFLSFLLRMFNHTDKLAAIVALLITIPISFFFYPLAIPLWVATLIICGVAIANWSGARLNSLQNMGYELRIDGFISLLLSLATLLIFGVCGIWSWDFPYAEEKAAMIGEVSEHSMDEWEQGLVPIDPAHLRWVAPQTVEYWADKLVSNEAFPEGTGSRFELSNVYIQRLDGRLVGVVPFEFIGYFNYDQGVGSPGYVVVSVEDHTDSGTPVSEWNGEPLSLKVMPSSQHWDVLVRRLYKEHRDVLLLDASFEIEDSNHRPWWVVTACRRTMAYSGRDVEFVILVDPQTGEDKKVELSELDQYPWIDRVLPADIALNYITWWGAYGAPDLEEDASVWYNGAFRGNGVLTATPVSGESAQLTMIWNDGAACWYTGLTSKNAAEKALSGFMLLNARSQKADKYTFTGQTEEAALSLVRSRLPKRNAEYGPAGQAVPANIEGIDVYVIPCIQLDEDNKGAPQGYAITPISLEVQPYVALGDTPQECLADFRAKDSRIAEEQKVEVVAEEAELVQQDLVVARISPPLPDGQRVLTAAESGMVLVGMPSTAQHMVELAVTKEGDPVTAWIRRTDKAPYQIQRFDNHEVSLYSGQ